jgi:uncharacterized protein YdiU (UPF0061 family)
MLEISNLNQQQLETEEVIKEIEKEAEDYFIHFESKFSQKLRLALKKKIEEFPNLSPVALERYKIVLAKLSFICLGILSEKEIEELFKNYFGTFLSYEIDFIEWIKTKLVHLHLFDDDNLREKINLALLQNQNSITSHPLILPTGKEDKPTVANWLKDYNQRVSGKKDRALARTEYLVNSPNIAKLSPEEKEKIKKLIVFYDFINTSPLIPSGYSQDLLIVWPNQCYSLISQGETIGSWLPPFHIPKRPLEEKKPEEIKPEEKPVEPKSALEEKYLEEEKKES